MFDAATVPPTELDAKTSTASASGPETPTTPVGLSPNLPTGSYNADDFARAQSPAPVVAREHPTPVLPRSDSADRIPPPDGAAAPAEDNRPPSGWAESTDGKSLESALDAAFSDGAADAGHAGVPVDRFAPGQAVLDQYRVVRQLGQGGMGAVYLARDDVSGQEVAIKVLPAELAKDKDIRERFSQEARALAALDHPNIVPLLTFATRGDDRYLVMKFVPGQSVDDLLIAQKKLDVETATRIFRAVVTALGYAHAQGVIHRDVKPGNVLLSDEGRIYLVDFGIAKQEEGARITQTGILMGTPQYMSPEQISGQVIDGRSDLYAAGLLFFEMLAGVAPFTGEKTFAILRAHVESPPPDIRNFRDDSLPDVVVACIEALLEKDPSKRPQSAEAVLALLDGQTEVKVSAPRAGQNRPVVDEDTSTPITAAIEQPFFNTARVDALAPPRKEPMAAVVLVAVVIAVLAGGYVLWGALTAPDAPPPTVQKAVDAGAAPVADAAHARIVAKGQKELEDGDVRSAISLAETVLSEDHDDIAAQELLVSAYIAAKNAKQAKAALVNLQVLATSQPDFDAKIDEKKAAIDALNEKARDRAAARQRARNALPDGLDGKAARKVLASKKNAARLQACWERIILARNPKAKGIVVTADVEVANSGSVKAVTIKRSGVANARFTGCIKKALKEVDFPKFRGPPLIVGYRATFENERRR